MFNKRLILVVVVVAMVSLTIALPVAPSALAQGQRWVGADTQPVSPLACGTGGAAAATSAATAAAAAPAAAAPAYNGALPKNPPDLSGKPITVVDVPKLVGIGYFNATSKGQDEAAKELGSVTVTHDGPTEGDIQKQIAVLENYLTGGRVQGILFAANDPVQISPTLRKALDAGLYVVGFDADAQPDARSWFVNQAQFNGTGDSNDAANFACRPARRYASPLVSPAYWR